jgi:hypothetical protein
MVFHEDSGAPLQGASVDALDARLQPVGRVVTDRNGQYSLTLPDTGHYVVSASLTGYAASAPEQVYLGPNEELTLMLELRSGATGADTAGSVPGSTEGRRMPAGVTTTATKGEDGTSYLYGRVVDEDGGHPVVHADVRVDGGPGTVTNGAGRFVISEVEPGELRLRFEHLSFAPQETAFDVEPGLAYHVTARMTPDPVEVEGIEVEARSRRFARRLEHVFQRMGTSVGGEFLTAEDFRIRGMPQVGHMLRGIPSVAVRNSGLRWNVFFRRGGWGGCSPAVYLDGMRVVQSGDAAAMSEFMGMSTFDVEVIEVYKGPASLPPEFNDPGTLCAIGIWTRRGG